MTVIRELEIETQKLQTDIDSLRIHLNDMRKTGDNMMAGVNALSSMWEGEAKNAFVAQFQSDYEFLRSMEDIIEDLIQNLEEARQKYDICENNVASIINEIRI